MTSLHPSICYIAIGSNEGERVTLCDKAVALLSTLPETTLQRRSSWYETEPVVDGAPVLPQAPPAWFINGVVELNTTLPIDVLFGHCLTIEAEMGRQRASGNFSRPIDLDLLLYGDIVLQQPELTVPHPRFHRRRFVLVPLVEIAPHVVHPRLRQSAASLLTNLSDSHDIRRLSPAPHQR